MSTAYGFRATLNVPYETAIEKATAALEAEGFGVLTEIDVQATLKQKIGADFRRYIILGVCNPNLAHQALQSELEVDRLEYEYLRLKSAIEIQKLRLMFQQEHEFQLENRERC